MLDLQKGVGIALTTDSGTGHTGKAQATTAHWIDESFEYNSAMLELSSLDDIRTTAEELSQVLDHVLDRFGIEKSDATFVCDNAANIQSACRKSGIPTERCACHSCQLVVVKELNAPDIKTLMDKVRNAVVQVRGKQMLNTYYKNLQLAYCTDFIFY